MRVWTIAALVTCVGCNFDHGVARGDASDGPGSSDGRICPPNWYDLAWTTRHAIAVDATKVIGTHAGFPMLFHATDAALIGAAGPDLLFTSGDGTTKLAHELEQFDSATGTVTAWVRVPTLGPDELSRSLFLYHGNPQASPQEAASDVWIDGYAAVFHMSETPATVTSARDSTQHARNAQMRGFAAGDQMAGKIAGSLQLDSNNRLDTQAFAIGSTFTLEAWVQPTSFTNQWRCIVNNDPLYNRWLGLRNNEIDLWDNSNEMILGGGVVPGTGWYHVAATYQGTSLRGYLDGTPGTTLSVTLPSAGNAPLQIGYTIAQTNEWFQGRIDEVRISSVARSPDYLVTSFNNQDAPGTFAIMETAQTCAP